MRDLRRWLILLMLGVAPPVSYGASGAEDLLLDLHGAVWHAGKKDNARTLTLRLERENGQFRRRVVGHARRYNQADHTGAVAEARSDGAQLRLSVLMRINPDPRIGGEGFGRYTIDLRRDGEKLEGTWKGTFRGEHCKGAASGTIHVAHCPSGFAPARPGEHPCLLIRRSDIPALRKKAQTPWGQKAVERLKAAAGSDSSRAVAQGLLYVLTDDNSFAQEARRLNHKDIDAGYWSHIHHVHTPAVRAVEGTIAYDLIHETCDAAFRKRMTDLLRRKVAYLYWPPVGPFNPHDNSNWSAMYRSAVGMVSLGLLGEPAELPAPPQAPELRTLTESAGLKVAPAAAVVKLQSGRTLGDWLLAGPLRVPLGADALDELGGVAAARPESGTRFQYTELGTEAARQAVFAPLDRKHLISREWAIKYRNPKLDGGVDFASATGRAYQSICYLYTVIENDRPGWYRLDFSGKKIEHIAVYLAGQRLAPDDIVRLDRGRFPLMVHVSIGTVGNWEIIEWYLRFQSVAPRAAEDWLRRRREHYEIDRIVWEQDRKEFEAAGRPSPTGLHGLGIARQRIAN